MTSLSLALGLGTEVLRAMHAARSDAASLMTTSLQAPSLDANSLSRTILFDLAFAGAAYRIGIHRKQLSDVTHFVSTELDRLRAEMKQGFASLGRRLGATDAFVATAAEQRVAAERWRGRADLRLDGCDRRLDALDEALNDARDGIRADIRDHPRPSLRREPVP